MPLPADPDLKPVAAAQQFLDAQAAAAAPATAAPPAAGPSIAPAEPDRWSRVIPLAYPLTVDGVRLEALTLRRLPARVLTELIMEDEGEESLNRRARAAIAGVHPDVLDALDADDAVEVAAAIRPFLPRALQGAELLELTAAAADALGGGAA